MKNALLLAVVVLTATPALFAAGKPKVAKAKAKPKTQAAPAAAAAAPAETAASATPEQPKEGKLGGGYKEAKWGMNPEQVKGAFSGKLEFESKHGAGKFLTYDLGEGRKVFLHFDQEGFYRAIFNPVITDGDITTAEAVLNGLSKKYGAGTPQDRFEDGAGRELRVIEWNDGISQIMFRMPNLESQTWHGLTRAFPKASVMVTYASVDLDAKVSKRRDEELKNRKDDKKEKKGVENDL